MKICGVLTKNLNLIIQFLDSLVVRISACHVEGPGSIPGRGEQYFLRICDEAAQNALLQVRLELTTPA